MLYRRLGRTDMRISEIGFGAWAIGGPFAVFGRPIGWGEVDDETSLAALQKAFDAGVNFIDTADVYGFGHSEEVVGKAIRQYAAGREIFVASKVGYLREPNNGSIQDFSADHIRRSCEESLRRLGMERLDLYQLHCVPMETIQRGEAFAALDDLQQAGKIRAYGVSIVTDQEAAAAMEYPGVQCVQIIFNVLRQKPLKTVFRIAKQKGVGILARVPLASGLLTGKFDAKTKFPAQDHRSNPLPGETFSGLELAAGLRCVEQLRPVAAEENISLSQMSLAWILRSDAVTSAIPGARTALQAAQNAAASGTALSRKALVRIEEIYQADVAGLVESVY